jgi:hypothetical protein
VQDRELLGLVLTGRDATGEGRILHFGAEESFEHGGLVLDGGLRRASSHMPMTVP